MRGERLHQERAGGRIVLAELPGDGAEVGPRRLRPGVGRVHANELELAGVRLRVALDALVREERLHPRAEHEGRLRTHVRFGFDRRDGRGGRHRQRGGPQFGGERRHRGRAHLRRPFGRELPERQLQRPDQIRGGGAVGLELLHLARLDERLLAQPAEHAPPGDLQPRGGVVRGHLRQHEPVHLVPARRDELHLALRERAVERALAHEHRVAAHAHPAFDQLVVLEHHVLPARGQRFGRNARRRDARGRRERVRLRGHRRLEHRRRGGQWRRGRERRGGRQRGLDRRQRHFGRRGRGRKQRLRRGRYERLEGRFGGDWRGVHRHRRRGRHCRNRDRRHERLRPRSERDRRRDRERRRNGRRGRYRGHRERFVRRQHDRRERELRHVGAPRVRDLRHLRQRRIARREPRVHDHPGRGDGRSGDEPIRCFHSAGRHTERFPTEQAHFRAVLLRS